MNAINSVNKIQSVCKKARIGAVVLFCLCIVGIVVFGFGLVSVLQHPAESTQGNPAVAMTSNAVAISQFIQKSALCVIYGISLLVCSSMFKGICDDRTPFRERTVKSLRVMSVLMLISSVAPYFLSFLYYLSVAPKLHDTLRLAIAHSGLRVAAVPVFLSIFLFVMTAVFKYGCILQQESDETL